MCTPLLSSSKIKNVFKLNRSETKNPCFGQAVLATKKLHTGVQVLEE